MVLLPSVAKVGIFLSANGQSNPQGSGWSPLSHFGACLTIIMLGFSSLPAPVFFMALTF
jgi:hypothetical protein